MKYLKKYNEEFDFREITPFSSIRNLFKNTSDSIKKKIETKNFSKIDSKLKSELQDIIKNYNKLSISVVTNEDDLDCFNITFNKSINERKAWRSYNPSNKRLATLTTYNTADKIYYILLFSFHTESIRNIYESIKDKLTAEWVNKKPFGNYFIFDNITSLKDQFKILLEDFIEKNEKVINDDKIKSDFNKSIKDDLEKVSARFDDLVLLIEDEIGAVQDKKYIVGDITHSTIGVTYKLTIPTKFITSYKISDEKKSIIVNKNKRKLVQLIISLSEKVEKINYELAYSLDGELLQLDFRKPNHYKEEYDKLTAKAPNKTKT